MSDGGPVRVAFVSHHSHLRMGGQRSMALLIEHLDRSVVAPLAICPEPGELADHLATLDCPVIHVPLQPIKPRTVGKVLAASRRIRALVRERAIDILAPDAERDVLTCAIARIGTPAKLLWFVRLTSPNRLDPLLERLADGRIGVSEATGRRFSRSPRLARRYRTIHDGADLSLFRPTDDRAGLRRALGLPEHRFVALFVGQVTVPKGVFDLVEAIGLLPAPRPLLVLVGTPRPASVAAEIELRARASGAGEDVRLLPQQDDVYRWMQAADVLVSASHENTEGLSRVLFEAMACGTVPIATDIEGNREALTPETGLLVPERSPTDLARAVTHLQARPDHLGELRAAGVRRARELFDIKDHARRVEQFCVELARPAPQERLSSMGTVVKALSGWAVRGALLYGALQAGLPPARLRAQDTIPGGYGSLKRDDIAVRLTTDQVELQVLPLDEQVIRCLAPDTYRSLTTLISGRRVAIDSIAERGGTSRPTLVQVTFYGLVAGARFSPDVINIQSRGQLFRPLGAVPLSSRWSSYQLAAREQATAIFVFDEGISFREDVTVTYGPLSSDAWSRSARLLDQERSRVRSRIGTGAPPN
ncbi:MAG TPA: glycosyltransferase family 4 protein [Gemmatimonadales bacterium]|nr:glycosyltransferase family 4 protein [Gemmatimonadales bacterium]